MNEEKLAGNIQGEIKKATKESFATSGGGLISSVNK